MRLVWIYAETTDLSLKFNGTVKTKKSKNIIWIKLFAKLYLSCNSNFWNVRRIIMMLIYQYCATKILYITRVDYSRHFFHYSIYSFPKNQSITFVINQFSKMSTSDPDHLNLSLYIGGFHELLKELELWKMFKRFSSERS